MREGLRCDYHACRWHYKSATQNRSFHPLAISYTRWAIRFSHSLLIRDRTREPALLPFPNRSIPMNMPCKYKMSFNHTNASINNYQLSFSLFCCSRTLYLLPSPIFHHPTTSIWFIGVFLCSVVVNYRPYNDLLLIHPSSPSSRHPSSRLASKTANGDCSPKSESDGNEFATYTTRVHTSPLIRLIRSRYIRKVIELQLEKRNSQSLIEICTHITTNKKKECAKDWQFFPQHFRILLSWRPVFCICFLLFFTQIFLALKLLCLFAPIMRQIMHNFIYTFQKNSPEEQRVHFFLCWMSFQVYSPPKIALLNHLKLRRCALSNAGDVFPISIYR